MRILYGVMGDAEGHVSRSLAIARQFKNDEIVFVGGGRVAEMGRRGYAVVPVPVLGTVLRSHRVDTVRTVSNAVVALQQRSAVLAMLSSVIRDFDPDLIVTDYEYFLPHAARRLERYCISVDRQHALTQCHYDIPSKSRLSRILTTGIIRSLYSAASHYLVCSFTPLRPIDPRLTEVVPPVLREEVLAVERAPGDHAVVYMRGASFDWLRNLLAVRRRRYIVYGFDMEREEGNLLFRRNSSEQFVLDLAHCSYVISNGGHNLISEALHFGKPVLCFPVGLFYEQLLNAHLLALAGYGALQMADVGAAAAIDRFESKIPEYERAIAANRFWDKDGVAPRLRAIAAGRHRPLPAQVTNSLC